MMPFVARVLVVGGGPSGLVAALTLLQNHIPVRIIDKEPSYRIWPAWQRDLGEPQLPRTFEVFHFLRAYEIHRRATPMIPVQEHKPGTLQPAKMFRLFPQNDPTPSIPYGGNSPMFVSQPTLEGALRSCLEQYGCFVELGTELQSFEDDGECVRAKLVKTKGGKEIYETFKASFLIGADGAKGVTRKQLALTFLGETKQYFASVVGDICLEVEGLDRKHWHFFGHSSSNLLALRPTDEISPDGFQFFISQKEYDPKQLIADEKLMFKCMSEMMGREANVRKVVFMSEYRPNIRMVEKFGAGRAFVAGDAAHVHSPTGGQGLNTCVQDAFNLAWKMSLVYKGLSPVSLLDSYTTERIPAISEMLNITTGILHKIHEAPTVERAIEGEKRLNMLGVNCRASPIVVDEFIDAECVSAYGVLDEGALAAGDRAPNATGLVTVACDLGVVTETSLFDVFSAVYHTVLVFVPDAASSTDVLEVAGRYGDTIRSVIVLPQGSEVTSVTQENVAIDRTGHAYRGYLAMKGERKVVVVRPDGVVGAIVHGVEGVRAYFAKIFL